MINEIKNILTEYEIKTITKQNYMQIMEVYNTNQEYFLLSGGKTAKPEDCLESIDLVPPDFNRENKIFVGIWINDRIIGVLDLLVGYPLQSCIWIGLLIIHGELHSKHIGGQIVNAILSASKSAGYKSIQLGVIDSNLDGLRFWQRYGFKKIRESKLKQDSRTDLNVIVMENTLV